ncbi:MAG: hypothetical protein ACR2H1_05825, partial [Limisphaerales bacterium]
MDNSYAKLPPEKNAATILTNGFKVLVQGDTNSLLIPVLGKGKWPTRNVSLTPELIEACSELLRNDANAFALIEKGVAIQNCRYPTELTDGWDASLPHLAPIKTCGLLLKL